MRWKLPKLLLKEKSQLIKLPNRKWKKYDTENMAILATKLKKEDAQAFKDLAAKEGTTVGKKLSGFVREELATNGKTQTYVPAVLTAKNADRLKHETAFHNPKNLNPDQLMN